MSGAIPKQM